MSVESIKFNQVTSVKLPRSASYLYSNLVSWSDAAENVSYYAVVISSGFEVWIVRHCDPDSLSNKDAKEPTVQLRKVPYDALDSVTCVKWCKLSAALTFVLCTESGAVHVYDFEAKKILCSHQLAPAKATRCAPTINCVDSDGKALLFVGTSDGALLSLRVEDAKITDVRVLFESATGEAIHCIARPAPTAHNANKNNKIYVGGGDGCVLQYDFYAEETDVLIAASAANELKEVMNDQAMAGDAYANNCGACVCIAACDEFVVAGYASGHIKIVQKSELSFVIKQVAVHRRLVTAVAILEHMSLVATASEDGFFHVLRNTTSSLEVVRAGHFENGILCGVQFVKSNCKRAQNKLYQQKYSDRMLVATAYDRNRIAFV